MNSKVVFDVSALLCLLNDEPGAERVSFAIDLDAELYTTDADLARRGQHCHHERSRMSDKKMFAQH